MENPSMGTYSYLLVQKIHYHSSSWLSRINLVTFKINDAQFFCIIYGSSWIMTEALCGFHFFLRRKRGMSVYLASKGCVASPRGRKHRYSLTAFSLRLSTSHDAHISSMAVAGGVRNANNFRRLPRSGSSKNLGPAKTPRMRTQKAGEQPRI